jgi:hypothetical protein
MALFAWVVFLGMEVEFGAACGYRFATQACATVRRLLVDSAGLLKKLQGFYSKWGIVRGTPSPDMWEHSLMAENRAREVSELHVDSKRVSRLGAVVDTTDPVEHAYTWRESL